MTASKATKLSSSAKLFAVWHIRRRLGSASSRNAEARGMAVCPGKNPSSGI
jgi:hypothetical protein